MSILLETSHFLDVILSPRPIIRFFAFGVASILFVLSLCYMFHEGELHSRFDKLKYYGHRLFPLGVILIIWLAACAIYDSSRRIHDSAKLYVPSIQDIQDGSPSQDEPVLLDFQDHIVYVESPEQAVDIIAKPALNKNISYEEFSNWARKIRYVKKVYQREEGEIYVDFYSIGLVLYSRNFNFNP